MILRKRQSIYDTQLMVEERDLEFSQNTINRFVKRFVDSIVIAAMKIISCMHRQIYYDEAISATDPFSYSSTKWPTCGNINVRNGLECVKEEMIRWNRLPVLKAWMFHVEFIGLNRKGTAEFYTYRVLWSIPIPAYPEPYVTVSVFFYIVASRVQPPHFPVDVSYIFEGHQFVHQLDVIFRPKWLYDILDMKTMLFKTFTF